MILNYSLIVVYGLLLFSQSCRSPKEKEFLIVEKGVDELYNNYNDQYTTIVNLEGYFFIQKIITENKVFYSFYMEEDSSNDLEFLNVYTTDDFGKLHLFLKNRLEKYLQMSDKTHLRIPVNDYFDREITTVFTYDPGYGMTVYFVVDKYTSTKWVSKEYAAKLLSALNVVNESFKSPK